jgi:hypothetical protein
MYSLNLPVSTVRTKIRQEFERHRYVAQLQTVDVLLFQSHAEFQVRALFTQVWIRRGIALFGGAFGLIRNTLQETLNYWKQLPHVLKYFRIEEDPKAKLPSNFMGGFLEVSKLWLIVQAVSEPSTLTPRPGKELSVIHSRNAHCTYLTSKECITLIFDQNYARHLKC